MLGRLAQHRTSALPGYAQDTADTSQVEGVESFLLTGTCGPRLAAVHLMTQALHITNLIFTVNLEKVHTLEVRRTCVVAAFAILLSISLSKERLSVIVETRFLNCSTTSSSYSSMVMACSSIVSCPRTLVFLRLMVCPKSLQRKTVHDCLQLLLGVGRHYLYRQRTACL